MDIITPIAIGLILGISINMYEKFEGILFNLNPFNKKPA